MWSSFYNMLTLKIQKEDYRDYKTQKRGLCLALIWHQGSNEELCEY